MHFVNHISDHDLERHYLGMVKDEAELASLEEHLLACPACVERAESTRDYVDALRRPGYDSGTDGRLVSGKPTGQTRAVPNRVSILSLS